MSDYEQLLNATIRHLEDLKKRGVQHVPLRADTWQLLQAAPAASKPVTPVEPRPRFASSSAPVRTPAPAEPTPSISSLASVTAEPVNMSAGKEAAFAQLRERALACVKCSHLASSRKNV